MYRLTGTIVLLLGITIFAGTDTSAQVKSKDAPAKKDAKTTGLVFDLYKDAGGDFRFRLKDGDTIIASAPKGYEKKEDCQKVIDAIKAGAARAKVEDNSGKTDKAK